MLITIRLSKRNRRNPQCPQFQSALISIFSNFLLNFQKVPRFLMAKKSPFSLAVSYHHVSLLHQHPLSPLFSLPNMRLIFSSRSLQLLISFNDHQSFRNGRSLSTHSQMKPGADVTLLLLLPAPLLLLLIRKNRLICEQCDVSITSTSFATLLCNRRDHQAGLISRPLALH